MQLQSYRTQISDRAAICRQKGELRLSELVAAEQVIIVAELGAGRQRKWHSIS